MTKQKVIELKWLCVAFSFLAFEFILIGIAIVFGKPLSHLAGRMSIAGGTYQVAFVKKSMASVGILCQIGFLISMALSMIASRERIRREAVHEWTDQDDVSAWPPAPRIDRQ